MRKRRFLSVVACLVISAGVVAFTFLRPDAVERQRRQALKQHAAIHDAARHAFERAYHETMDDGCTPETLAEYFQLPEAPQRVGRADGGSEICIDLPESYSRLIVMWGPKDRIDGFAWELVTPALDDVSWERFVAGEARGRKDRAVLAGN